MIKVGLKLPIMAMGKHETSTCQFWQPQLWQTVTEKPCPSETDVIDTQARAAEAEAAVERMRAESDSLRIAAAAGGASADVERRYKEVLVGHIHSENRYLNIIVFVISNLLNSLRIFAAAGRTSADVERCYKEVLVHVFD